MFLRISLLLLLCVWPGAVNSTGARCSMPPVRVAVTAESVEQIQSYLRGIVMSRLRTRRATLRGSGEEELDGILLQGATVLQPDWANLSKREEASLNAAKLGDAIADASRFRNFSARRGEVNKARAKLCPLYPFC